MTPKQLLYYLEKTLDWQAADEPIVLLDSDGNNWNIVEVIFKEHIKDTYSSTDEFLTLQIK